MASGCVPAAVGDLFRPLDALPADTRLAIARVVATPGTRPAVLHGELAAGSLPTSRFDADQVVARIVSGCSRRVIATIAELRLDQVVPALAGMDGGPAASTCSARLLGLLDQQGCRHWSDLGPLPIAALSSWPGVGSATIASLLGVAMGAALDVLCPQPDDTELDRAPVSGSEPESPSVVASLDQILGGVGDDRCRASFELVDLPLMDVPSAVLVAGSLDISGEQIRPLRTRARAKARAAFDALPEVHPLRGACATVREGLGAAAPIEALDAVLAGLGLPSHLDTRSQLLVHLAGPYRPVKGHRGWVATDARALATATDSLLGEDGGVRPLDQVVKELDMVGLHPAHAEAWIRDQPVRLVADLVVLTTGAPVTVAERALNAVATSMTTDELAAWIEPTNATEWNRRRSGDPRVPAPEQIRRSLVADRRFRRVAPETWELAEWGATAYIEDDTHIFDDTRDEHRCSADRLFGFPST